MAGNDQHRTKGRMVATAERRRDVLELRKSGATFRMIADHLYKKYGPTRLPLGYDERYAFKDLVREMERIRGEIRENARDILEMDLERLDRALLSIWGRVQGGDLLAIDRMLRIIERRAKMLGLDAATSIQAQLTGADGGPLVITEFETVKHYAVDDAADFREDTGGQPLDGTPG